LLALPVPAEAASSNNVGKAAPRPSFEDLDGGGVGGLAPSELPADRAGGKDAEAVDLASGALRNTVARLQRGRSAALGVEAVGSRIRVEILHDSEVATINQLVARVGGSVEGHVEGQLTQAIVPFDRLEELAAFDGIQFVRPPLRVDIEAQDFRGVANPAVAELAATLIGNVTMKTNAAAWHAAGYTGRGVRIGIIDGFDIATWNGAMAAGEVPAPTGTFCRVDGQSCDIWAEESPHGVAVAEVIHEMAPDAEVFLGYGATAADLEAVVDYFAAQGVDIISRSLIAEYDGPGDGTGPVDAVVDLAISHGMTWFNAAGNAGGVSGGSSWEDRGAYSRSPWVDADGDGWLDFAPGDELLEFNCAWVAGVRWNDWGESGVTDYDVFVFSDAGGTVLEASSEDFQGSGGAPPVEHLNPLNCPTGFDFDYLAISVFDPGAGTGDDVLEFLVNSPGVEYWQNPYSATTSAVDTASPGGIAVGAIDPAEGTLLAPYSSRGPTNDGRIKPELSAVSCLPSFSYFPDCFGGTSAATPVAAGAAALILSANLTKTPSELKAYLLNQATVDRGSPGADNDYGRGELVLPAPPSPDVQAPVWTTSQLTVTDVGERALTLAWEPATDDRATVGYLVFQAAGDPGPGTNPETQIASLDAGTRTLHVSGLTANTRYAFRVEAFDAAGNVSIGGPRLVATTAIPADDVGLVDPTTGIWRLRSKTGAVTQFYYGNPRDIPFAGDWDCDGIETPGLFRQSDAFAYLRNSNSQGIADIRFFFGNPGDVPLAGDFNGDGCDTVSIYRPSEGRFYIINELGQDGGGLGAADIDYLFGNPGDKPFVGDFDGDGVETVGLHRESTGLVYIRQTHTQGIADAQFIYGNPGDRLVAGDWNSNGMDSPALFRPSNTTYFFRFTNTQGTADAQVTWGQSHWLPVAGSFGLD
jgi:hypothetical protein